VGTRCNPTRGRARRRGGGAAPGQPQPPDLDGGPALNALATIMLVLSFVVAGLGFLGYRWLSRGERIDRKAALTTIAGA
jgi:hypothetical protein